MVLGDIEMNRRKLLSQNVDVISLHSLRSHEEHTLQGLLQFESDLEAETNICMKKVLDYIAGIKSHLATLKCEIQGDYSMELRDADYYRVSMFQLEGKITQLNHAIRAELYDLMKEEGDMCNELQNIERRIDEWSKPFNAKTIRSRKNARIVSLNEDPTTEFQNYLANFGGHTGGWEEQDHLLFLRERKKFKKKDKFISAVQTLLPDICEEEVQAHESWYENYEKLKDRQKEAIKNWRASRQTNSAKISSQEESERVERKPRGFARQRDITERIKEWKRQQLLRKAEEEERQREEQQKLHEERIRNREIQKAKKSTVDHYKAEKLSRMQADLLAQQMKDLKYLEDRAKKNVLLKAFREQDQQLLEKKKMQKLRSELKEKRKEDRLKNLKTTIEISVERDPQRVLQATQVWNNRCMRQDVDISSSPALNLHNIPHLGIPSWRKSLTSDTA